jgi:hypothetical protein
MDLGVNLIFLRSFQILTSSKLFENSLSLSIYSKYPRPYALFNRPGNYTNLAQVDGCKIHSMEALHAYKTSELCPAVKTVAKMYCKHHLVITVVGLYSLSQAQFPC